MAEAIARYDAADVIEAHSAGVSPLGFIARLTKETLMKNGYSADDLTSDPLTPEASGTADIIINMTGRQKDIYFSPVDQEKVEDWIVQDPYDSDPETYQRVFESIKRRINQLAIQLREKREHRTSPK
jgi:protein-tyrosine-phosphatase